MTYLPVVHLTYNDKAAIEAAIDIKLGYRYVHYAEDESRNVDGNPVGIIYFLGYSRDGERTCFEIADYPLRLWHRDANSTSGMSDAYGKPISEKTFPSLKARWKYVNSLKTKFSGQGKDAKKEPNPAYPGSQIVCCDKPEIQFMKEFFLPVALSTEINKGKIRVFYLDIETEISGAFMPPYKAENRINMITVMDSETGTFHTWSLKPVKPLPDADGTKYAAHDGFQDDERKMLLDFLCFWTQNYPDVVCGWNSLEYDMPYIVRRCEIVLGETNAKKLSPFGEYWIKNRRVGEDGGDSEYSEEIENVVLPGISQLDEMLLYRDKFKVKTALDGGYGLSNVGQAEGLGGKTSYEGTLLNLYESDWQKFYEYNVRDVDLLYAIEQKCKLIPLARTICGFGFCNYEEIYHSVGYLVQTLSLYTLKNRKNTIFNSYANKFCEQRPYEGAYVFQPVPNRYCGGIACVDFNSLYPSCMRALNLSPETYVGRIIWPEKDDTWETWQKLGGVDGLDDGAEYKLVLDRCDVPTGQAKTIDITKDWLKKALDEKCLICGPNFTLFLKHEVKRGIIADWCADFFAWRKSVKKEMGKALHEAHIATDPAVKAEMEAKGELLNNLQNSIKIMLNSAYGILGLSSSPLYNPSIVQSITRLGKFCNINGSRFYRKWLEENYHIGEDYVSQASGDTDSSNFSTKIRVKYLIN